MHNFDNSYKNKSQLSLMWKKTIFSISRMAVFWKRMSLRSFLPFFCLFFLKTTNKQKKATHVFMSLVAVCNLTRPAASTCLSKAMLFWQTICCQIVLHAEISALANKHECLSLAGGCRHAVVMLSHRSSHSDCRVDLVALQLNLVQMCKLARETFFF